MAIVELRHPSVCAVDLPFRGAGYEACVAACVCWRHSLLFERLAIHVLSLSRPVGLLNLAGLHVRWQWTGRRATTQGRMSEARTLQRLEFKRAVQKQHARVHGR